MDKDQSPVPKNTNLELLIQDRSPESLEKRKKEVLAREADTFGTKKSDAEVIEEVREAEAKRKHRATRKDPRLRCALLTASVAIQDLELVQAYAHAYNLSVSELVRDALSKRMNVEFAPVGRRRAYKPRKEIGRHIMREIFEGRAAKPLKL